jgi:hypothetical protein
MMQHFWFGKALFAASLLLALGAAQARAQEASAESRIAFEVVAGKLKQGGDMAALRKADKAVEILISKQKGFIYRETASGKNGEWFVIVHWASLKDAENAAAVFMSSEEGKVASSMLDQSSVLFMHYVKEE